MLASAQPLIDRTVPADPYGRPSALDDRLAMLCGLLEAAGYSCTPSNLHHLSFWDEAISPILGCRVWSVGFERGRSGPRSRAVQSIVSGWIAAGLLRPMPQYDGDGSQRLYCSPELGRIRAAGAGRWQTLLAAFIGGWGRYPGAETTGVCGHRDHLDILSMMLQDPAYRENLWDGRGPGAVMADCGRLWREAAGKFGNAAVAHLHYFMASGAVDTQGRGMALAASEYHAVRIYARHLMELAAAADPDFGAGNYRRQIQEIVFRQTELLGGDRVVNALEFVEAGRAVGYLELSSWKDRELFHYPSGNPYYSYPMKGEIRGLRVEPWARGRGIGTLLLRTAVSLDCDRLSPELENCEDPAWKRLLALHSYRTVDGLRLCRVSWPLCLRDDSSWPDAPCETSRPATRPRLSVATCDGRFVNFYSTAR